MVNDALFESLMNFLNEKARPSESSEMLGELVLKCPARSIGRLGAILKSKSPILRFLG